ARTARTTRRRTARGYREPVATALDESVLHLLVVPTENDDNDMSSLATHPNAAVRTFDGAGHSFLIDPSVGVPWKIPRVGPHPAAAQAWEAICEFLDPRRDVAAGDFVVPGGQ
ncbi:MAG: hypothetical protein WEA76_02420, partial [Acidimicrobiia bacterium]